MNYNPLIHHRRSIRLKEYDYSKSGAYIITIGCENRLHRFGEVVNSEMQLNELGRIAFQEWVNLTSGFSNFDLGVFQIMPNHMHGIMVLKDADIIGAYKSIVSNECLRLYKSKNIDRLHS